MLTILKILGGLAIAWLALQVFGLMFSGPGMFVAGVIILLILMSYFGDDLTDSNDPDLIDIRSRDSTKD